MMSGWGFIFHFLGISIIISLLCLPYYYYVQDKDLVGPWDYLTPFTSMLLLHFLFVVLGLGAQGLFNILFYIIIIPLIILLTYYLRMFSISKGRVKEKGGSIWAFFLINGAVVVLVLLTPNLHVLFNAY